MTLASPVMKIGLASLWRSAGLIMWPKLQHPRPKHAISFNGIGLTESIVLQIRCWHVTQTSFFIIILILQTIDNLLRCGICCEFLNIAMILPKCSHNCKSKICYIHINFAFYSIVSDVDNLHMSKEQISNKKDFVPLTALYLH